MSDFITKNEFEVWKQNFEKRLTSILSGIQNGTMSVPVGSDVTVTFPYPFPAVPTSIIATANRSTNPFIINCHSFTATNFKARGVQWDNGSGASCAATWIAKL